MFLSGALLRLPYLDIGTRYAARFQMEGEASAQFAATTGWDQMLAQDNAPIAWFAEIEPHVLADRS